MLVTQKAVLLVCTSALLVFKIGIISSTVLVALGFLMAIWAVAIKYCQQASKKGIFCALIYFLDKFFKGLVDFLQTII